MTDSDDELDEAIDDAVIDAQALIDNDEEPTGHAPTDAEYTVAFSPRQLAGGFAIIAALIILIARRRRKKS